VITGGFIQRQLHDLSQMQGMPSGALLNLFPAAETISDDEPV